ncbi:hypothetical protein BN14_05017 [Rhizoctonia solani AG-1 IB]|uniref:Pterin-binding domain-containing protein n=1 Tax=Thanatephorus cucumeris (strain AG1-IB / isolate 7/3/14) TaxID=1108050 RepID=M5BTB5_THACB|nr:hypothetical protein BN14_05017 [Rhizoctonia solani AG-1 IB]
MAAKPKSPKHDLIIVDGLSVHTTLGASHWPRPGVEQKLQPLVLSITVPLSLAQSGTADNLDESVSYGSICKVAEACASQKDKFSSVESLSSGIADACFGAFKTIQEVQSVIEKQRALLHAKGAGVKSVRLRQGTESQTYFVRDLELSTIIGLHPWERVEKQLVRLNLEWSIDSNAPPPVTGFDFRSLVARVSDFTVASEYQTVESLAAAIAQVMLQAGQHIDEVTVRVGKPSALMMANTAAVQITRTLSDFGLSAPPLYNALDYTPPKGQHVVILALGSNMGDRFVNIEKGLQALEREGIKVVDTSYLYDTKAMYHEDQASFVNGVCAISTSLNPTELIALLKRVETEVGRTATFRNGPRVVDLDILFYDDLSVNISEGEFPLQIPHPRIQEREFVLRPLADIIPAYTHPTEQKSIQTLLSSLPSTEYPMHRVMPLNPTAHSSASAETQHPYWTWGSKTYLMATLNTTPDSFSDGGDHVHTPESLLTSPALRYVRESLKHGADILDIGGYSTRPGATSISPEAEIARVVPAIRAIREAGIQIPISVDTFRGEVARAALTAGANWINDVRAGRGEYASSAFSQSESIFDVAHEFGCPIVLMHSRELANQDKSYSSGTLEGVREELGQQVAAALRSGVRRWNIIADPGYGFSKSISGNIELVRNLRRLVQPGTSRALGGLPILAGTSRKSYLGSILARSKDGQDAAPVPAKEREWATAAAVTACIQAGADVVRVHNVEAMRDVIAVADKIWRSSSGDDE